MDNVDVIIGQDLIRYKQYTDFVNDFADILDPNGYNVVVSEISHENVSETKLYMLFKIVNQEEPFEGTLTIPYVIYKQIKYRMSTGDINVH